MYLYVPSDIELKYVAEDSPLRWQRCKPDCGCNRNPSRNDTSCREECGGQGCERGYKEKLQLSAYALAVTERLTGPPVNGYWECPITGLPFLQKDGEIDRIHGGDSLYDRNTVIMTSKIGNQERAYLQREGSDLPNIKEYLDDVRAASKGVRVVTFTTAKTLRKENVLVPRVSDSRGHTASVNALRGPYA